MRPTASALVSLTCATLLLAGCTGAGHAKQLTATSRCSDFLGKPLDVQNAAVQMIAGQQHNGQALTPLGRPNVDYFCGNDPGMTLGDAVARAGGKNPGPGSSTGTGAGSASAGTSAPCTGACFTDPGAITDVLAAAKTEVAAVLSYDYRHLAQDAAAGLAATTGTLRSEYRDTMATTVKEMATASRTVQAMTVEKTAIVALSGDKATVLVFGQQNVTNARTGSGSPQIVPTTHTATVTRVNARWLLSALSNGSGCGAAVPGSADLTRAVAAGSREILNVFTLSVANVDADYQRSIDGATGALRRDRLDARQRTVDAVRANGKDLTGDVLCAAVEAAEPTKVTMLVLAQAKEGSAMTSEPRLELTMTKAGGVWLASDMENVGLS